jgi:hypothetical protein
MSSSGSYGILSGFVFNQKRREVHVQDGKKKFKPNDGRIQVRFSPEEIVAAKAQMRQRGIGTLGDYLRWVLRGEVTKRSGGEVDE